MDAAQGDQEIKKLPETNEKITYHKLLREGVIIARELFIVSLIFYLILFILELIFPGFVSYNFSLNLVLGGVLLLGLIAAFAPEVSKDQEKGKNKPKILDYMTSVFLGTLGGLLLFAKIGSSSPLSLIGIGAVSFIITTISIILLTVEDDEVKEKEKEIEVFFQNTFLSRKTFIYPIAFLRLLLFKKINFPMILILIVFMFTIFSLPPQSGYQPRKFDLGKLTSFFLSTQGSSSQKPSPTPTLTPSPPPEPKTEPSRDLLIKVFNGSTNKEAAENFSQVLRETGFEKVFFGQADNDKYKNAEIKFRAQDENQAKLIKDLLEGKYSVIKGVPLATTSSELVIILGDPAPKEEVSP